ncbi:hypothetical protein NA57DRAFT_78678 [Rhizodiscina lignyota]|uniref:Uncharacterized protein n=1 Tax=Rhizodiscina lignyota TaxID=1504668 RepID=A0A9P4IAL9_9PEZI|nr:hypothetical protein NA57DRAFT_78678 [Rhizodiscina lignyota]
MPPQLVLTPHLTFFLRKTTVFTFPPALILCVVHGIVAECAVPALGLIPLFASAVLGAFLMYRDKIAFSGSPISLTRAHVCLSDFGLGVALIAILIPSWIFVPQCWQHRGDIMLGTYATVPLMINFAIHVYFFAANGLCFLSIHEGCPNCRQSLHDQEFNPALSDMEPYRDLEDQPPKPASDDYVRLP